MYFILLLALQAQGQRPKGVILKYDLLSNNHPGLTYGNLNHLGAFVPVNLPPGVANRELQEYVTEAATQDNLTNVITITSFKDSINGRITSARLETYRIWSTAQAQDIKFHGYVEVQTTLPVKANDGQRLKGSWPAIWMLGSGSDGRKDNWPRKGEIDIIEAVNGDPYLHMSLHSTRFNGIRSQHPPGTVDYFDIFLPIKNKLPYKFLCCILGILQLFQAQKRGKKLFKLRKEAK